MGFILNILDLSNFLTKMLKKSLSSIILFSTSALPKIAFYDWNINYCKPRKYRAVKVYSQLKQYMPGKQAVRKLSLKNLTFHGGSSEQNTIPYHIHICVSSWRLLGLIENNHDHWMKKVSSEGQATERDECTP